MEKNANATLSLSNYTKQLDEIRYHLASLNYLRAITRCKHLIDQLTEVLINVKEERQFVLNEILSDVYKLLQNSYFNWLLHEPNQFGQNLKAKNGFLKNLKAATSLEYFSEQEKQHSQFLVCFTQLLFSNNIERDTLEEARISFCDLYNRFVEDNHTLNQALVLFGLALIAAYEGDLCSTYQGLNHASNAYPKIHKLVKAIEYQLPRTMSSLDENAIFLMNPLAKFRLPEIVSSLKLRQ